MSISQRTMVAILGLSALVSASATCRAQETNDPNEAPLVLRVSESVIEELTD